MTDQQGARIIELLEGITERLDFFAAVPPDVGCEHPEDKRVSLSSFGDPNHWVCKLCKFDNKSEALEAHSVAG